MFWREGGGKEKVSFSFSPSTTDLFFSLLSLSLVKKKKKGKKEKQRTHVGEPGVVQSIANRPNAPVHHVRRGDAVGSGPRLRDRLAAQELDGLVIEDLAVVGDDAVVPVAVVRVERDVGVDLQVGELGLQEADGALDETVRVEGLLSRRGLEVLGRLVFEFFFFRVSEIGVEVFEKSARIKRKKKKRQERENIFFSLSLPLSLSLSHTHTKIKKIVIPWGTARPS